MTNRLQKHPPTQSQIPPTTDQDHGTDNILLCHVRMPPMEDDNDHHDDNDGNIEPFPPPVILNS